MKKERKKWNMKKKERKKERKKEIDKTWRKKERKKEMKHEKERKKWWNKTKTDGKSFIWYHRNATPCILTFKKASRTESIGNIARKHCWRRSCLLNCLLLLLPLLFTGSHICRVFLRQVRVQMTRFCFLFQSLHSLYDVTFNLPRFPHCLFFLMYIYSLMVGWYPGISTHVGLFYAEVSITLMVSNYIWYENCVFKTILNRAKIQT